MGDFELEIGFELSGHGCEATSLRVKSVILKAKLFPRQVRRLFGDLRGRGQKSEVRSQRTEDRSQRTEASGQKPADRSQLNDSTSSTTELPPAVAIVSAEAETQFFRSAGRREANPIAGRAGVRRK